MPTEINHMAAIDHRLTQLETEHAGIKLQLTDVKADVSGVKAEVVKTHSDFKTEIAVLKTDLNYIRASQEKVVAGLNRILWAVALVLIGGVGSFAGVDPNVYVTWIDKLAASTEESVTVVYDVDRPLFVRVRDGGGTPIRTFETPATLGSGGGSVAAIRTNDA